MSDPMIAYIDKDLKRKLETSKTKYPPRKGPVLTEEDKQNRHREAAVRYYYRKKAKEIEERVKNGELICKYLNSNNDEDDNEVINLTSERSGVKTESIENITHDKVSGIITIDLSKANPLENIHYIKIISPVKSSETKIIKVGNTEPLIDLSAINYSKINV